MAGPKDVYYLPPGDTEWRRVESVEDRRGRRLAARKLLAEADVQAKIATRRIRRREKEVMELERDMAASLGAWERMVAAGARKILRDVEDLAKEDLSALARKLFGDEPP